MTDMNGTIEGKKVLSDALFHTSGAHPRIILKIEDFARLRNEQGDIYRAGRDNIIRTAEALIQKNDDGSYCDPLCTYVIPDGIRLLSTSRKVLDRVMCLAMAWHFTDKDEYAQRAIDEMESALRFPDWNPYHFLDVGEMSFAFAIGYDWLYHRLSEDQRRRLRVAMIEKGLRQIQADFRNYFRRRSYRWYQDMPGDNWKFICNGGLTAAALAIFDEAKDEQDLIVEVLECAFADSYKAVRNMYYPDGSYSEGFNYWNYASTYLAYYTSSLISVTGCDYGLTDHLPLKKSAYYVKYICSNRFICFNFGDASENNMCVPVFLWFAKNFNAGDIAAIRTDFLNAQTGNVCANDLLWYDHNLYEPFSPEILDIGDVGSDNASFRSSWDADGFYAAIHFGNNDAYHHHLDTGTFVVDNKGKRFISDLGADNYNVPVYRFTYRYRAEGHNTLVIDPVKDRDQSPHSHCPITQFKTSTTEDSFVICDMSEAYFGTPVVRGMKMLKERDTIIVRDEIGGSPDSSGIWSAHTKADISLSEDRSCATLTIDKESIRMKILSGQSFEVAEAELIDPNMKQEGRNDNSKFKKLIIRFTCPCNISVAISENTPENVSDLPLCEWK